MIEKAIKDLKQGKFVIVSDEQDEYLILSVEHLSAELITDMQQLISGPIRRGMTKERFDALENPGQFISLSCKEGGVLKRAGSLEAAVDLVEIASLIPEVLIGKYSGTAHDLTTVTIPDLIRHRRKFKKLIKRASKARMPTRFGEFTAYVYESELDEISHMAIVKGDVEKKENVLVRVHSECLTGDVFSSRRCDCGYQLEQAMEKISEEGSGVIVYLRGHEGRGIGLAHKLKAYALQDQGRDTVEANIELGFPPDTREYGIGAHILADLGLTTIRLMTNNPAKYGGLEGYDLSIVERVPLISGINSDNYRYMQTKKEKMGHLL